MASGTEPSQSTEVIEATEIIMNNHFRKNVYLNKSRDIFFSVFPRLILLTIFEQFQMFQTGNGFFKMISFFLFTIFKDGFLLINPSTH